jgi:hypothetical protein
VVDWMEMADRQKEEERGPGSCVPKIGDVHVARSDSEQDALQKRVFVNAGNRRLCGLFWEHTRGVYGGSGTYILWIEAVGRRDPLGVI